MIVITFASRKGGSGKSTLAAHLATCASKPSRPTLVIDTDPQGSLSLWHELRGTGEPVLKRNPRSIEDTLKAAKEEGYEYVFIDTPPSKTSVVTDAIRASTLVLIPARASLFDLAAVRETIDACRQVRRPYAVVINAAPAKREDAESPIVTDAREGLQSLKVPVWNGQITNRSFYSLALAQGQGAKEFDAESLAAEEISQLFAALDRSAKAVKGLISSNTGMHKLAA
jgi:chromosome partitioning protein